MHRSCYPRCIRGLSDRNLQLSRLVRQKHEVKVQREDRLQQERQQLQLSNNCLLDQNEKLRLVLSKKNESLARCTSKCNNIKENIKLQKQKQDCNRRR